MGVSANRVAGPPANTFCESLCIRAIKPADTKHVEAGLDSRVHARSELARLKRRTGGCLNSGNPHGQLGGHEQHHQHGPGSRTAAHRSPCTRRACFRSARTRLATGTSDEMGFNSMTHVSPSTVCPRWVVVGSGMASSFLEQGLPSLRLAWSQGVSPRTKTRVSFCRSSLNASSVAYVASKKWATEENSPNPLHPDSRWRPKRRKRPKVSQTFGRTSVARGKTDHKPSFC